MRNNGRARVQVLKAMWSLIAIAVVSSAIYGWWIGDVRGGLLLGFLPAAVVAVAANCIALTCDATLGRLSKLIWVGVAVLSLIAGVIFTAQPTVDAAQGADTVVAYAMLVLAFPISLLAPVVIMWLTPILPAHGGMTTLAIMWVVFFGAGCVQWFVLIPWLWRKRVQKEVVAVDS